jgi:phosphatidylserine/phosphatidylglycerophosphate/cardiolipin synthase-like enzyme
LGFADDVVGLHKLALLRDAARRGVKVRLVLDGWGSRLPRGMIEHLARSGVEIRYYHPMLLTRLGWLPRRLHEKWLVVDGQELIVGDRNLGRHYFGIGRAPWRSRETYIRGEAAGQAQAYALKLWDSAHVRPARWAGGDAAKAAAMLDRMVPLIALRRNSGMAQRPSSFSARARFSHDALEPGGPQNALQDVLRVISLARKSLLIANAYVVLSPEIERALAEAVARGVRVTLITNSPATHNIWSVRFAYGGDVRKLVAMGLELWEFGGPGTLHMKALVADEELVYDGSVNLYGRSSKYDTESGAIIHSAEYARQLAREIEKVRARSTLIARERRLLQPAAADTASRVRRFFVGVLRRLLHTRGVRDFI